MNKNCIVVIIALAIVALADPPADPIPTWTDYKKKQNVRTSSPEEDKFREALYNENVKKIKANNADPNSSHMEGVNQFTALSQKEFAATYLTVKVPKGQQNPDSTDITVTPVVGAWSVTPVDLTTKANYITPVKNQGGCGSCWAFSAVAALESLQFIAYGVAGSDLSEQQLTSCSGSYGNGGCNGGWMNNAFNYVKAQGITTESAYPYNSGTSGSTGTCSINTGTFKISGYTPVNTTCTAVATAVKIRPLAVAVDATNWNRYVSGVFKNCNRALNHAVLLVGVNSTAWKVKNSWSTTWGVKGYMSLSASNGNNTCGICGAASYPNK